jgi:hypothetical protein
VCYLIKYLYCKCYNLVLFINLFRFILEGVQHYMFHMYMQFFMCVMAGGDAIFHVCHAILDGVQHYMFHICKIHHLTFFVIYFSANVM